MASVNWNGSAIPANNEWNFAGGWSTNAVPASADTITVPAGTPTLVLTSTNSGGPVTATDVTVSGASVQNGAGWVIQLYPHNVNIINNLQVDGAMSVISDPFDKTSCAVTIGGTLAVTNSGGGFSVGGYFQGADPNPANSVVSTVTVTAHDVTNNSGTNNGSITVQSDVAVGSTATLNITSAAGFSGQAGVLIGNVNIGSDGLHAGGKGLIKFASGQITTIQGANANFGAASLSIYGSQSFLADAGSTNSNSALVGLANVNGALHLQAGAQVSTGGAVTIDSNGGAFVDTDFLGVAGSQLAVGGTLAVNGILNVGRSAMTGIGQVTAASLSGTGSISVDGSDASNLGKLLISGAAGFGTAGTLTGNVNLNNYSLLQFGSGQISTIAPASQLAINSSHAFLADAGSTSSNSALTGLTNVNGALILQAGAAISTAGAVTIGNNGAMFVDTAFLGTAGSQFAVGGGGGLTVNGILNIGRSAMTGIGQVTAASLSSIGSISLDGSDASNLGKLVIGSAAGFGAAGTLTGGYVNLGGYGLLQFASGQISTIAQGAQLAINSGHAFLADAGSTTSNSALAGLATVNGGLIMQAGATIATGGALTIGNNGGVSIDTAFLGTAGSLLTVGGALTVNGFINVGRSAMTGIGQISAVSLAGGGTVSIDGSDASNKGKLVVGSISGGFNGTITVSDSGFLEVTNAVSGGTIAFNAGGTVKFDHATNGSVLLSNFNSAGETLELAGLTFKSSYIVVLSNQTATSAILNIEDSANNNAIVASVNLTGTNYNHNFALANDSSNGTAVTPLNASAASIQAVQTAATDILRHQLSAGDANTAGLQLDNHTLTIAAYGNQLASQVQGTTVPALITYDFFFGKIPASAGLDFLANFAAQIQTPAGGGFSVINTFVNLAATNAINPSSTFATTYGVAAVPSEQTFFNSVYTQLFGHAPSQAAIDNYFHTQAFNLPNGTTITGSTFDFYREYVRESLPVAQQTAGNLENGARGAVVGTLLYFANGDPTTQYSQSTTHFFQDGTVETPHYQVPLIGAYLASSTPAL